MLQYILNKAGVTFFHNSRNYDVSRDHVHYAEVVDAIKANADGETVLGILNQDQIRLESAITALSEYSLSYVNGVLSYDGQVLDEVLTERILQMHKEGFDLEPMGKFVKNLFENPSYRAVSSLYAFLEYGRCPITEDGCFLVYKAVRADYKDIHSGTFDNSVGAIVEMRRSGVDEDPDRTCSAGLHVCSYNYLPHFAHSNGHVMICKVNPRDVVAIPRDYNNTKMRVCSYTVIDELQGYYKDRDDVLAKTSVAVDTDAPFQLQGKDEDGDWQPIDSFDALTAAAHAYDEALKTETAYEFVRLVNTSTDSVLCEDVVPGFVEPVSEDSFYLTSPEAEDEEISSEEFETVNDAMIAAIDWLGEYSAIDVRSNRTGEIVRSMR